MPGSRAYSFRDPNAYQSAIRAAEAEVVPTGKGAFQSELIQVNLQNLWMQRGREQLPRIMHYAPSAERVPIIFAGATNAALIYHDGKELPSSHILVDGADTEHHHRSSGPSDVSAMSLRPEDLIEAGRILVGHDLSARPGMRTLQPPPELLSRLRHLHATVVQLAKTDPAVLTSPDAARAIEYDLTRLMVRCLTESESFDTGSSHRRHSAIISRFKDLLAANTGKPLYLSDMCAATGASERTLRNCCQDTFGMGPIRYLWLRRMQLAQRALALETPKATTVTRIATEHGFWELGRFATEYRALFGEAPSATLRRAPHPHAAHLASTEQRPAVI